ALRLGRPPAGRTAANDPRAGGRIPVPAHRAPDPPWTSRLHPHRSLPPRRGMVRAGTGALGPARMAWVVLRPQRPRPQPPRGGLADLGAHEARTGAGRRLNPGGFSRPA